MPNRLDRASTPPAPRILVVDADDALRALLEQWLRDEGFEAVHEDSGDSAAIDVAIIDIPQPRHDGAARVQRVAARHPQVPVVALSSAFFPGIEHCPVATSRLGVAAVLAKPMVRESLIRVVRGVLPREA